MGVSSKFLSFSSLRNSRQKAGHLPILLGKVHSRGKASCRKQDIPPILYGGVPNETSLYPRALANRFPETTSPAIFPQKAGHPRKAYKRGVSAIFNEHATYGAIANISCCAN